MSFAPILGVALSAGSAILGGLQANAMADYQAQVAERNAQIAEDNAERAIHRSQVEAQDQDMQNLAYLGQQEAAQSASGLGGRSQFLTRKAGAELGRRDTLNVRQAGEIESYNYRTEAMNQRAEAEMADARGSNALLSGFLGATKSLVGNARTVRNASRFGAART